MKEHLNLGYQVLIAAILGIATGLFLGPLCSIFNPIGQIFAMLLQMVVLPYISFSLMHGLGSMSPQVGKKLFFSSWHFFILLWGIVFGVIYLMTYLIPTPLTASLQSSTPETASFSDQFLSYLVPANPIYDFANNIVPAIAIFGLIVGLAIMHLQKKEPLLSLLERANSTIEKILFWIAKISPIGVFAHLAVAVGTVNFFEMRKWEFYLICLIVIVLLFVFWILPLILISMTPLKYREIIKEFRDVALLSFVTALPSLAFPFILRSLKKIANKEQFEQGKFSSTSQTVIPIGFSLAQLGNALIFFFLMFLAFFYRQPYALSEKVLLNFLTIPMSFGTTVVSLNAVSFLIKQLNFPDSAFKFFTEANAIALNFQVLLSITGIYTFILLVIHSDYGMIRVKWRKLIFLSSTSLALFLGVIFLIKPWIQIDDNYLNLYEKLEVAKILEKTPPAQIVSRDQWTPEKGDPLPRILRTGILRVGYDPHNIPFCYANEYGDIVGFDIAMAYELSRDLDCKLELVEVSDLNKMAYELSTGRYDIMMSAIVMNEERILTMLFSDPYTEQMNVLVAPNTLSTSFENLDILQERTNLTIGGRGAYLTYLRRHFPKAQIVNIEGMAALEEGKVDAVLWSLIPSFIWCLGHPNFTVMNYGDVLGIRYFAYPVNSDAHEWLSFINHWVELKKQSGIFQKLWSYWIEGNSPPSKEKRWSILKNVLHWGEEDS